MSVLRIFGATIWRGDLWRKARLAFACLVVVLTVGAFVEARHQGYCFGQRRVIPDAELAELTAARAYRTYELMIDSDLYGRGEYSGRPTAIYSDAEELRARNPDCCRLVSFEELRPKVTEGVKTRHILSGFFRSFATAEIEVVAGKTRTVLFFLSSCGDVHIPSELE